MASRYSRKDGAQENNMIIDFEQYKREHAPEAMQSAQELEALEGLNSAFSNFLGTFSTNGMMMDIHTIDELKGMTDEELLQIRGIGKARVAEIREALEYED